VNLRELSLTLLLKSDFGSGIGCGAAFTTSGFLDGSPRTTLGPVSLVYDANDVLESGKEAEQEQNIAKISKA
jgi:hypothetical protein